MSEIIRGDYDHGAVRGHNVKPEKEANSVENSQGLTETSADDIIEF